MIVKIKNQQEILTKLLNFPHYHQFQIKIGCSYSTRRAYQNLSYTKHIPRYTQVVDYVQMKTNSYKIYPTNVLLETYYNGIIANCLCSRIKYNTVAPSSSKNCMCVDLDKNNKKLTKQLLNLD